MLTHVNFPSFAMADPSYGELMRYRNANTDRLELIFRTRLPSIYSIRRYTQILVSPKLRIGLLTSGTLSPNSGLRKFRHGTLIAATRWTGKWMASVINLHRYRRNQVNTVLPTVHGVFCLRRMVALTDTAISPSVSLSIHLSVPWRSCPRRAAALGLSLIHI